MRNFNPEEKVKVIVNSLTKLIKSTKKNKVVINWSGGIDSTVCLYLLAKSFPINNITILHLPYDHSYESDFKSILKSLRLHVSQFKVLSIRSIVDEIKKTLTINESVRLGNVKARVRMILAYDFAKKYDALVCGTENKTEHLLGYFTRFGDGASDIEPILNVYKTEIFKLGEYLSIPKTILNAKPSAGLWDGQTDEGEFGFTYQEADEVLYRIFEKSITIEEIEKEGFQNAKKIMERVETNAFKQKVPYII